MKLLYVMDNFYYWRNGCWLYRNHFPSKALKGRGHKVQILVLGTELPDQEWLDYPDTVVFSRTYGPDPIPLMRKYKQLGKKVVYDIDDDLWTVNPDNPSANVSEDDKEQYETLMREVDVITTTTPYLANVLKKMNKNVEVCPNALDFEVIGDKPNLSHELRIVYSGAASHWNDMMLITEALIELRKKYEFLFIVDGMTGSPLASDLWEYQQILRMGLQPERKKYFESAVKWFEAVKSLDWQHEPFWSPMLFHARLSKLDFDIGLAPLQNNQFNYSKSCNKFYEYASCGAATVASDILPYNKEVGYCAKNTTKDWIKKIEKLIVDKKFRDELAYKQYSWVKDNRDIRKIAIIWERVLRP